MLCMKYKSTTRFVYIGAIFILCKDLGVGGWSRKWQFSLTLCSEKCPYVGGWVVQKSLKTPLRNIKMAPNQLLKTFLNDGGGTTLVPFPRLDSAEI